jgi:hypothetical protein
VTDNQGWQPPTTSAPSAQPIAAWQQQQQSQPGWAPPPKPGLIPLHPLSFGTIVGSSFRVMRRNPGPTFGLSVLLYGFVTIVYVGMVGALFALTFSRLSTADASDTGDITAGSIGLIAISTLVPTSLALIATAVLQGIISLEVSRATLGEKLKVRGLWRLAKGRIGTLVLWSLLLSAAIVVFVAVAAIATGLVFAVTSSATAGDALSAVIGVMLLTLVIGLAFAVVAAWLGTKTALVPSIIMLERLSLFASIRRSWQLTHRNFWRTLGVQLLIGVIVQTASSIITFPISMIGGIVSALINPASDEAAFAVTLGIIYLLVGIVTVVVGAIGLVMQSASLALIYIDIRMRNEGLDLELLHFVEAKQSGTAGVENPYLRLQGATSAPVAQPGSPWA